MSRKKRTLFIVLPIALVLLIVGSLIAGNLFLKKPVEPVQPNGDAITRAEWASMIATAFNMLESKEKTPLFQDVDQNHPDFDAIQNCSQWGLFVDKDTNFYPDKPSTNWFVISSAVETLVSGKSLSKKEIVDCAMDFGLLTADENTNSFLNSTVSKIEAQTLLDLTCKRYLENESEARGEIKLVDSVKNYSDKTNGISYDGDDIYTVDADIADSIAKGDVLILPGDSVRGDTAVKVSDIIENSDGSVKLCTETPEIEELLENFSLEGTSYANYEDIIPNNDEELGLSVEVLSIEEAEQLGCFADENSGSKLGVAGGNAEFVSTKKKDDKSSFVLKIKWESDKLPVISPKLTNESGKYIEPQIAFDGTFGVSDNLFPGFESDTSIRFRNNMKDDDLKKLGEICKATGSDINEVTKSSGLELLSSFYKGEINYSKLKQRIDRLNNKQSGYQDKKIGKGMFDSGYSVTGELKFENFAVTPSVNDWKNLTKNGSVTVSYDLSASAKVEGKIENEVKLADFPIVHAGVATLNVQIFAYFEMNGSVKMSTTVGYSLRAEMNEGHARATFNREKKQQDFNFAINAEVGGSVGVAVYVFGLDVFSVRMKVAACAEASYTMSEKYVLEEASDQFELDHICAFEMEANVYLPIISVEINKTPKNIWKKLGVSSEIKLTTCEQIKENKCYGIVFSPYSEKSEYIFTTECDLNRQSDVSTETEEEPPTEEPTTDEQTTEKRYSWIKKPFLDIDNICPVVDMVENPVFDKKDSDMHLGDWSDRVCMQKMIEGNMGSYSEGCGIADYSGNVIKEGNINYNGYYELFSYSDYSSDAMIYCPIDKDGNLYPNYPLSGVGDPNVGIWQAINKYDQKYVQVSSGYKLYDVKVSDPYFTTKPYSLEVIDYSEDYDLLKDPANGLYSYYTGERCVIFTKGLDFFKDVSSIHAYENFPGGGQVIAAKGEKYGYYGYDGSMILPEQYDEAYPFYKGIAAVKKDGKAGLINEKGEIVIPFEFEETRTAWNGKAWVKQNGLWGVIEFN